MDVRLIQWSDRIVYTRDTSYQGPVAQLLTLGQPDGACKPDQWEDYEALGLNEAHVDELVRMVGDQTLSRCPSEQPDVWAPLHAWRALGQLKAIVAVEPLLAQLAVAETNDDDWGMEEIPQVIGLIGPAAIGSTACFLADPTKSLYARSAAGSALVAIAKRAREHNDECVDPMVQQIARDSGKESTLSGLLIGTLLDLDASSSAGFIEQAYAENRVDTTVTRWNDVAEALNVAWTGKWGSCPPAKSLFPALPKGATESALDDHDAYRRRRVLARQRKPKARRRKKKR